MSTTQLVPYGYIYKTTNKINGKIYIGQKAKSAFDPSYIGSGGRRFQSAIKHYGRNMFEVFPLCWCWSREELDEKEIEFIAYFDAKNLEVGYNMKDGGHTNKGYVLSAETKEKIRKANTGKKRAPRSEEWKAKISEVLTGCTQSEETKQKRIESMKGLVRSVETKEKISLGRKQFLEDHPEVREQMRQRRLGTKASEETRKKSSESHLGVKRGPMSEEHKAKIRASRLATEEKKKQKKCR